MNNLIIALCVFIPSMIIMLVLIFLVRKESMKPNFCKKRKKWAKE